MTDEQWISKGLPESEKLITITPIPSQTEKKIELKMFDSGKGDETKKGLDVLIYGDSNSGKTYFAATFPEPLFLIDTEDRANKTRQFYFPNKDFKISHPTSIRTDFKTEKEIENAVDMEKSVDNLINSLIDVSNYIRANKITSGTLIIDSMSDVWSWIQEEGKIRLAKAGKVDMAVFRLKSQFDWGGITNKMLSFFFAAKTLTDIGINVVFTSREKKNPDYISSAPTANQDDMFEGKIKTQKLIPFYVSTIINMNMKNIKTPSGMKQKRTARIEKLESISGDSVDIENITYEKLKAVIDEKRKQLIGGI